MRRGRKDGRTGERMGLLPAHRRSLGYSLARMLWASGSVSACVVRASLWARACVRLCAFVGVWPCACAVRMHTRACVYRQRRPRVADGHDDAGEPAGAGGGGDGFAFVWKHEAKGTIEGSGEFRRAGFGGVDVKISRIQQNLCAPVAPACGKW